MAIRTEGYLSYPTNIRKNEIKQIATFDPITNRFSEMIIQGRNVGGIVITEYGKIDTDYKTTHKINIQYHQTRTVDIDPNSNLKITGT